MEWLPANKRAAVCFSVDDIHPSTSDDLYEAGGDLADGVLGRIAALLERHSYLKAALFVTPDWRPKQLVALPERKGLDAEYQVDLHPSATFAIERHPEFVRYLNGMPRTEVAAHGLQHVNRGDRLAVEFANKSYDECVCALRSAKDQFSRAQLNHVAGFSPPGWELPDPLIAALSDEGFTFVGSARDLRTPIRAGAVTDMSGLKGVSLLGPERISAKGLIHVPTNFQATSGVERALAVVDTGGLLSIKAHAFKDGGGHHQLDGLDEDYADFLSQLFELVHQRYGNEIWWASMSELATAAQACDAQRTRIDAASIPQRATAQPDLRG